MGGAPKITTKEGEWVNICAFVYESVPMLVVLLIQDWSASATLHNTCVLLLAMQVERCQSSLRST